METNKILKVAGAVGAGIVLISAGALGTSIVKNDTIHEQAVQISQLKSTIEDLNNDIVNFEDKEPVIEYVDKEVIKEVEKNVTVEVPVDNGNLDLVLDHIYDNKGKVSYLTEDLDDDEVDQIVDRVVFMNEIKKLAVDEVSKEFKDLIDKEDFNGTDKFFDEDDVERVRVQYEDDELVVKNIDFEDKDAEVEVEIYFEQDDVKYKALVEAEFKDNKIEDINLISVVER